MHCHHEKLVIVDGERAFVGGIDLTALAGDRFDSGRHPFRGASGWHDATTLSEGPIVGDVAMHFAMRWREVTGEQLPPAPPAARKGDLGVQLARTVPEHVYDAVPRGDFSILEAYVGALRAARRLVYLENQFLWSSEIIEVLAGLLRNPPTDAFRMLVVLPAHPSTGADDTRGQLAVLSAADVDRATSRLHVGRPRGGWRRRGGLRSCEDRDRRRPMADRRLGQSQRALALQRHRGERRHRRRGTRHRTRHRLWAEHLELPLESVAGDPTRMVDEVWRPTAAEQLARRQAGSPLTHRLVLLPGVSHRSRRLLGPIQSLLVDG